MLIIAGVSASQGSFSTIPQPENMSTSSGKLGECRACGHMNNEQSYHKCTVCKKRDAWKICQATASHPNTKRTSIYGKCKGCCSGGGPFPSLINDMITCCKSKGKYHLQSQNSYPMSQNVPRARSHLPDITISFRSSDTVSSPLMYMVGQA